ncbi:MAG: class I SAM-dependent methyltransferase [Janthinobacterium lividum]
MQRPDKPERLDRFMARANAAYYANHDPFRDFTTAPEISQVFGEILGLWAAIVWEQMGQPAPVLLAELGPGRGTLMRDARRAIGQAMPDFAAALRLHLVETSPRLRAAQAALLPDATWHDDIATLPPGPMILLANEFLDALPIRQFVRRGEGWTERFVTEGRFTEAAATETPGYVAAEGDVVEVNEPARAIAATLAARLASQGGAALFLDYGPARSAPGDSLQALRTARPADPLADPGAADLTAHVDFQAFADHAVAAQVHGPVQQGPFLAGLGLFQRSGRLARTQDATRASQMMHAAQRLAEPDRMGGLFKALALCQPGQPVPPGFE